MKVWLATLQERVRPYLHGWFPYRQFILKQGTSVRAIGITPRTQMIIVGCCLAFIGWTAWSSAGYLYSAHKVARKNDEINRTRQALFDVAIEVGQERDKVLTITQNLEYYRAYMLALVEKKQNLVRDGKAGDRADQVSADAESIAQAEKALRDQLSQLGTEISGVNTVNGILSESVGKLTKNLAGSDSESRIDLTVAKATMDYRVGELERNLSTAKSRIHELETTVSSKQAVIEEALTSRRISIAERNEMAARAAAAEKRMQDMASAQETALNKLSEQTRNVISEVERIVNSTGLNVRQIVPPTPDAKNARGGPFVPWRDQSADTVQDADAKVAKATLNSDIDRLSRLKKLLAVVPLSSPLTEFSVTSSFGYRIDPFNNRPAFHEGLDMAAPPGTPVYAPAPGKVVFAGQKPAFGNIIEVEHGFGIRTRYAHLQRILVNEGDVVNIHDRLGLVGQTGRAQAPHLHYEVVISGDPHNPVNFLKATSHVLKGQ